jgi:hypothetical protein
MACVNGKTKSLGAKEKKIRVNSLIFLKEDFNERRM